MLRCGSERGVELTEPRAQVVGGRPGEVDIGFPELCSRPQRDSPSPIIDFDGIARSQRRREGSLARAVDRESQVALVFAACEDESKLRTADFDCPFLGLRLRSRDPFGESALEHS